MLSSKLLISFTKVKCKSLQVLFLCRVNITLSVLKTSVELCRQWTSAYTDDDVISVQHYKNSAQSKKKKEEDDIAQRDSQVTRNDKQTSNKKTSKLLILLLKAFHFLYESKRSVNPDKTRRHLTAHSGGKYVKYILTF